MSSFYATSGDNPTPPGGGNQPPASRSAQDALTQVVEVLGLTALDANAGQPSRLANLGYANITTNTNSSAQNAIANQQAHAKLNLSVVGQAVNRVKNLSPLEARSSVDVLTNDEIAQALADLRGAVSALDPSGGPAPTDRWQALVKLLRELLSQVLAIEAQNNALHGSGTAEDPYYTDAGQALYVTAPFTLVFVGVPAEELNLGLFSSGDSGRE